MQQLKKELGKELLTGDVTLPLALAELFAGLSKHVDLKPVNRLELGSGAVAMRYVPRR